MSWVLPHFALASLFISPFLLFVVSTVLLMWSAQLSLLSRSTPRYFVLALFYSVWLSIFRLKSVLFCCREKNWWMVFDLLIIMLFSFAYALSTSREWFIVFSRVLCCYFLLMPKLLYHPQTWYFHSFSLFQMFREIVDVYIELYSARDNCLWKAYFLLLILWFFLIPLYFNPSLC